ncbi:MAG: gamma-butyrobetaine hydroxylase-like domain-containing protein [Halochromatium sp.]
MVKNPLPTEINLHQKSCVLEIAYDDGARFRLPCEYLRVYSPSAEVRGHTPDQAKLQIGKERVNIRDLEQIGSYAVKIVFDDGHRSGLYDWQYLYKLGRGWQPLWLDYLSRLKDAGRSRSAPDPFELLRERGERPAELPAQAAETAAAE